MRTTIKISSFLTLICFFHLNCLAEESGIFGGGFGSAKHFDYVEKLNEDRENVVSVLEKPSGVYKLVQTSVPSEEIRKYTSDTDYETLYFMVPELHFYLGLLTNRLVDVHVDNETEEVSILLSQAQGYIYLKSVKNYKAPPLGEFALDEPTYLKQTWKPVLMVYFVPPELDPIYFSEKILEYDSAALTDIDAFELRSSDADNNQTIDSYSFSTDGVKKNGIKFEDSVSVRKRPPFSSQQEFLEALENSDDERILKEKEFFSTFTILDALSSFDDQPRAQAVKMRIEALLNE